MLEYLPELMKGLKNTLTLSISSVVMGLILSFIFTVILVLKIQILSSIVRTYITLFTGTPLLVQFFLIYYGLGQFSFFQNHETLWHLLSEPWLCSLIALSLNSASYTTRIFYSTINTIPFSQWQSCNALGMSKRDTLEILLPYAFKRSLPAYFNEVMLIFKNTSLSYTITLTEVMGYGQMLYGRTYDAIVFFDVGIIYLVINFFLTILMRFIERRALAFEL